MSYIIPNVVERDARGERSWDVYSRLLKDRIIFLGTPIYDEVANAVIAQMLYLQMEDPKKDIYLYINCPGGSVTAGMAIYDTMQFLSCDVTTYCVGQAASMAAVLLAGGTKGKRNMLPHRIFRLPRKKFCVGVQHSTKCSQNTQDNQSRKLKKIRDAIILCRHTTQKLTASSIT